MDAGCILHLSTLSVYSKCDAMYVYMYEVLRIYFTYIKTQKKTHQKIVTGLDENKTKPKANVATY